MFTGKLKINAPKQYPNPRVWVILKQMQHICILF